MLSHSSLTSLATIFLITHHYLGVRGQFKSLLIAPKPTTSWPAGLSELSHSLTRSWGALMNNFPAYFWGVQEPTKHSEISHTPTSGCTGHQAQHQPYHLSYVPQTRGTVFNFHEDLCLFSYFFFPTCVSSIRLTFSLSEGQEWHRDEKMHAVFSGDQRVSSASLNRLGLFQPLDKVLPISYTFM